MDYEKFLEDSAGFNFVHDSDAAVKAICGILASRMDEADAREFTSRLPELLTLDRFRGHQQNPADIFVEDAFATLVQQFHISREEARELLTSMTRVAREATGRYVLENAAPRLPRDWAEFLTEA